MTGLLVTPLLTAGALAITAACLSGFRIAGARPALKLGLILCLLNATLRPIMTFFALPWVFLSLGLLRLVINGLLLDFATDLVGGVESDGLWISIKAAALVSVLVTVGEHLLLP